MEALEGGGNRPPGWSVPQHVNPGGQPNGTGETMPTPLTIISSTYSQIVLLGPNIGPLTTRSYLPTPLCYFAILTAPKPRTQGRRGTSQRQSVLQSWFV